MTSGRVRRMTSGGVRMTSDRAGGRSVGGPPGVERDGGQDKTSPLLVIWRKKKERKLIGLYYFFI